MKVRDIETGMPFRRVGDTLIYIARGSGWYSSPGGYDGGPWHSADLYDVEPVPVTLSCDTFDEFTPDEVLASYVCMTRGTTRHLLTDGDRALTRNILTILGFEPLQIPR